jgi:hypothetical protein
MRTTSSRRSSVGSCWHIPASQRSERSPTRSASIRVDPSLPAVFVKGTLVGGYNDLKALIDSGELKTLLAR